MTQRGLLTEAMSLADENDCSKCGLCKAVCPIFRVTRSESFGPRCRMIQMKEDKIDPAMVYSTLCSACDAVCPVGIEISKRIKEVREKLVLEGHETEVNKRMIENIRKHGNPFGKIDGKPKELFCC